MPKVNKYGLSRDIPASVKREVRQRSKFGCVVCRLGIYQYEHIDPLFEDAREHNAERMCCLCGACHDSVTRGQISKTLVMAHYQRIQRQSTNIVSPPTGPLDFHSGTAELSIGGLLYTPAVETVIRYYGQDLIRVSPGQRGQKGSISAGFTDDEGNVVLRLVENGWEGSLENWDIEIEKNRIKIRRGQRDVTLQLRLEPPGRIVVERLDMKIGSCHVLATEQSYVAGRYFKDGTICWAHVAVRVFNSSPIGAAIEFADREHYEMRDRHMRIRGRAMANANRSIVMNSFMGVMIKELGIAVASLCNGFALSKVAVGSRPIEDVRRIIITRPEQLSEFIAMGSS